METIMHKALLAMMLLCCMAFSIPSFASPISLQQAQQNARVFLQQRGKRMVEPSLRQVPMTSASVDYYVFNIGEHDGYVIAAGDDCVPPVLGYADEGAIDVNNIPCNMQAWLDGYAHQIQLVRESGLSASSVPRRLSSKPAVAPLLTSKWSQGYPYYMYCPLDTNGRRCVTGCVATAMAQVLYYHRSRSVAQTTHEMAAYVTPRGVSVDAVPAGSFIDWDNMVDRYLNTATTDEQKAAVANLMKYCGTAVQMVYTSSESAAYTSSAAYAMVAFFNYSSRTRYLNRDNSGMPDEDWENLVYEDLSNSRPVLYSGWSDSNNSGHAFVCDGYDGEGYFHINWGWGASQGYYLLTAIDSVGTSLLNYSSFQEAVFHAEPRAFLPLHEDGIPFVDPIAEAISLMTGDADDNGVLTVEEAASVTEMGPFTAAYMSSFDEFRYFNGVHSLCYGMFYECNKMKGIVLHDSITSIGEWAFKNCTSLAEITVPCNVSSIGNMAFAGCSGLKRFIWNARNCAPTVTPIVNGAVEQLVVGDSVEVIPNNFAKNARIKDLTIGKSVNKIGASAFYGCSGLKRVVIPNSVETINQKAFYENTALEQVTLGNALTLLNSHAFYGCRNLRSIAIPNSVTQIGMYAFSGCTSLSSVLIGSAVSSMSSNVFSGCDSLKVVTCLVPEPLAINVSVFKNRYEQAILRVPAASLDAYKAASPWNQFSEIVAIDVSQGDVNLDGVTNVADLTDLIDQILEGRFTEYGDVNGDGEVNVGDVAEVVDLLLAGV